MSDPINDAKEEVTKASTAANDFVQDKGPGVASAMKSYVLPIAGGILVLALLAHLFGAF